MSYYRNVYLRSEHWAGLRLQKLVTVDACCERCGHRDLSNDVHHVRYKKLYDVTPEDLVVLCRRCHDTIHVVLDAARDGTPEAVAKLREHLKAERNKRHETGERRFKFMPSMNHLFRDMRKKGLLKKRKRPKRK